MKNYLILIFFNIFLFLFLLNIFSLTIFSQQYINIYFDWLSSLAEKYGIQFTLDSLFLEQGIDSIGVYPLFRSEFNIFFLGSDMNFLEPIYYFQDDKIVGYTYTIKFGTYSISKKISLNKYFTYYPGLCFNFMFSSRIITDKDYEEIYRKIYPETPYELNLKIGTSQSIEYRYNDFIFKFSVNIFYDYYDLNLIMLNGDQTISKKYIIHGHYLVFQFFLLPGYILRKNIKIFWGLTTYFSTDYLILNSDIYQSGGFNGYEVAPVHYPYEAMYNILENIKLVFFISIG